MGSRKTRPHDLDPVVDAIYEAAVTEGGWTEVMQRMTSLLSGRTGLLQVVDPMTGATDVLAALGLTAANVRDYEAHYASRDLWAVEFRRSLGKSVRPMTAMAVSKVVPVATFENSEIWNDWSKPHLGVFYALGSAIPLAERSLAFVAVHRPRDAKDFGPIEEAVLQRLLPHLRRAIMVAGTLAAAKHYYLGVLESLDALAQPLIVVDEACRMLYANAAAEAILSLRDGLLRSASGQIVAASHAETQRLHRLIAEAAPRAVSRPSSAGGAVAVARGRASAPLAVMVSPMPAERVPALARRPMALLLVGDPQSRPSPTTDVLIALFGLTRAEARIADALAQGERLEDAAECFGISVQTVRTQLKSIFSKTGARRQADLVRLALTSPATLMRRR